MIKRDRHIPIKFAIGDTSPVGDNRGCQEKAFLTERSETLVNTVGIERRLMYNRGHTLTEEVGHSDDDQELCADQSLYAD